MKELGRFLDLFLALQCVWNALYFFTRVGCRLSGHVKPRVVNDRSELKFWPHAKVYFNGPFDARAVAR